MAAQEHSAGVVLYHGRPRHYLLLHYPSGHWDFPKGHVEAGESDLEAALREVQEETGIRMVHIRQGFLHTFSYSFRRGRRNHQKSVTYFAGRAATRRVQISHEHRGYVWLPYERAVRRTTYPNATELLQKVEAFLEASSPKRPAVEPQDGGRGR